MPAIDAASEDRTPEGSESFSTAQRFAWVLHPWIAGDTWEGSLPIRECWPATICELSADKADLVLRREFSAGAVVELHLHTQEQGRVRWLAATVAEAQPLAVEKRVGRWLLTCHFAEPLTPDELRLLQQAAAG